MIALVISNIIIILIFTVWFIISCCYIIVPERKTVIIERFGKYHKQCASGISSIFPFVDKPRKINFIFVEMSNKDDGVVVRTKLLEQIIDLRENILDFEKQTVITADRAIINIDAVLFYKVTDPRLAMFRVINLPYYLKHLSRSILRDIIAQLTLDDLLSQRQFINDQLQDLLESHTLRIGITISRVEVQNIIMQEQTAAALTLQLIAERERRASILDAEGNRDSLIILSAANSTAQIIHSEADKKNMVMMAKAYAKVQQMESKTNVEVLAAFQSKLKAAGSSIRGYEFLLKLKYIDQLKKNSEFDKVVIGPNQGFKDIEDYNIKAKEELSD
eukprot:EST48422.1 Band 7/Mec-2 family protein [Spironucleus salmonicida]